MFAASFADGTSNVHQGRNSCLGTGARLWSSCGMLLPPPQLLRCLCLVKHFSIEAAHGGNVSRCRVMPGTCFHWKAWLLLERVWLLPVGRMHMLKRCGSCRCSGSFADVAAV